MIKVLHYGISSNLGGIETYSYKLARNFDMNKYQFDFLYLGKKKPCFYEEMKALGCNFIGITSRRENYFKYLQELNKVFKEGKWDVVHLHLNSLDKIDTVIYALKYGHKVIVHSRNGGNSVGLLKGIAHKYNFNCLKKLQVTRVAVSDLAGEWMFGKDCDFKVINNGIDLKNVKYSVDARIRIREELNLKNDTPVIVHVGSFKTQKNHEFLIDIFNEICKKDKNYKLLLVGQGKLMTQIKEKVSRYGISSNVIFLGIRNDISDILSAGDYFLFPSFYEGFPNALIEAETSGLNCLVSDTITDNVIFSDNCIKLSLEETAEVWANKLLEIKISADRALYFERAKENKMDVESEIETLEHLYISF